MTTVIQISPADQVFIAVTGDREAAVLLARLFPRCYNTGMPSETVVDSVYQAVDFIYTHLDEPLSVGRVADACCFSPYYFNRMFREVTGQSLYACIRRLKLERSAYSLVKETAKPITDIAIEAGFSPSNFATAFRNHFGWSPVRFRTEKPFRQTEPYARRLHEIRRRQESPDNALLSFLDERITVHKLPPTRLVTRKVIGPYSRLGRIWHQFCMEMEPYLRSIHSPSFIGISFDDPLITDSRYCVYNAALEVPDAYGPGTFAMPGGPYACYSYYGPHEELLMAFNDLTGVWMPTHGYTLGNGFVFERYHTGLDETGRFRLDLCAPIKRRHEFRRKK